MSTLAGRAEKKDLNAYLKASNSEEYCLMHSLLKILLAIPKIPLRTEQVEATTNISEKLRNMPISLMASLLSLSRVVLIIRIGF